MFDRLGRIVAHHPKKVLLAWLVIGVAAGLLSPAWEERCQDDDIRLLPQNSLSVRGHHLLKQAFPNYVFGSKVVFAFERDGEVLSKADLALVDRAAEKIREVRAERPHFGLRKITSYRDPIMGTRLISEDHQCTLVMVAMDGPFLAFRTTEAVQYLDEQLTALVQEHGRENAAGEPIKFLTTGASGLGRDLNEAAYSSLDQTTIATVVLVVVVLLFVYRSPVFALVPLATIAVSVWLSLRMLALLSLIPEFQLVNITRVFVIVVLYGAGTDYCLFLISRYREEIGEGKEPSLAMWGSLRKVGAALFASAGTVVCGLAMMGFAQFAKLKYTGPAIALSLVVALLASLTLAPALLRVLGKWAFWPQRMGVRFNPKPRRYGPGGDWWEWFSGKLARYPGRIWLATVLLLAPLAVLGLSTEYVYDFCAELPTSAKSIQGMAAIRKHFTPGELGPLTVLLTSDKDWKRAEGRAQIAQFTEGLTQIPNVAEVRSLSQPQGKPLLLPAAGLATQARVKVKGLLNRVTDSAAQPHYLAKVDGEHVARLDVVFQTDPFARESLQTLHDVRAYLDQSCSAAGAPVYALFGITSITHDLAEVHEADRLFINGLVLACILVILLALVRRPFLAVYLLVTVLFSYYATIGATELLSLGWVNATFGRVDWKVPYFLFTILVAIGEDYNIFLMARVLEEAREHGMFVGTQRALARTGGTITSCGLIMAGTFATMMLCSMTTLIQLGLALAVGVLLDTFIVRPILVPAFLFMMYRPKTEEVADVIPMESPFLSQPLKSAA